MEVAETMGAVDRTEDFTPAPAENEVPIPVAGPSSVSGTPLVDRTPPLRECPVPYRRRQRAVGMALSNHRRVHRHRESKTEWHGHIMVGSVLDLCRQLRLATSYVGCPDCDTDSKDDDDRNANYRRCCAEVGGEVERGASDAVTSSHPLEHPDAYLLPPLPFAPPQFQTLLSHDFPPLLTPRNSRTRRLSQLGGLES